MLIRILGVLLFISGICFLGQNIIFATTYFFYYYRSIPTIFSLLSIMSGIITLIFLHRQTGNIGWLLLCVGVAIFFLNGGVILGPNRVVSLLIKNFIAFTALAVGYKLASADKIKF